MEPLPGTSIASAHEAPISHRWPWASGRWQTSCSPPQRHQSSTAGDVGSALQSQKRGARCRPIDVAGGDGLPA